MRLILSLASVVALLLTLQPSVGLAKKKVKCKSVCAQWGCVKTRCKGYKCSRYVRVSAGFKVDAVCLKKVAAKCAKAKRKGLCAARMRRRCRRAVFRYVCAPGAKRICKRFECAKKDCLKKKTECKAK